MTLTRRGVIGSLAATMVCLPRPRAAPAGGVTILEATPGTLQLLATGKGTTAVWAYNGTVPGPLLRVKKGEEVQVRLINKLTQPTTLCWHGVRIVNAMDGVAGLTQAAVPPGQSFNYRFTPPDAGLYWYHPHVLPGRAEQIGRGLYGLLLVDEPDAPTVDQDHLVVVDEWRLDENGQIVVSAGSGPPTTADPLVTVNSKPVPSHPLAAPPGARLRFRLVNVSSRVVLVAFDGMRPWVVAIDGQPSELFPPAGGMLPIGPGARFDVIADVIGDTAKPPAVLLRETDGKAHPLMTFAVKGTPVAARPPIARLPPNPLLPTRIPLEKAIKPHLEIADGLVPAKPTTAQSATGRFGGLAANGFAPSPVFKIRRGGAVSLALVNKTPALLQMHVHGHVFRVLHDLDDGWDPYWRDSVLVAPGHTKHIAFIADNPGAWAIDNLLASGAARGLAPWFAVG